MPSYQLRWEVAGQVQLSRTFTRLALDLRDLREPLRQVAHDVIYPEIRHQFDHDGEPAWPGLSPGYARLKARRHPGVPLLIASGALRRSLTEPDQPHAIYELTADSLTLGTSLPTPGGEWNLGLLHQLGAARANIPPRLMLRLRAAAQTQAVVIFENWFTAVARREEVGV